MNYNYDNIDFNKLVTLFFMGQVNPSLQVGDTVWFTVAPTTSAGFTTTTPGQSSSPMKLGTLVIIRDANNGRGFGGSSSGGAGTLNYAPEAGYANSDLFKEENGIITYVNGNIHNEIGTKINQPELDIINTASNSANMSSQSNLDNNAFDQWDGILTSTNGTAYQYRLSVDVGTGAITPPTTSDYFFFSKDNGVNLTSITGYYAETEFKNNSTKKAELFATACDVVESSK